MECEQPRKKDLEGGESSKVAVSAPRRRLYAFEKLLVFQQVGVPTLVCLLLSCSACERGGVSCPVWVVTGLHQFQSFQCAHGHVNGPGFRYHAWNAGDLVWSTGLELGGRRLLVGSAGSIGCSSVVVGIGVDGASAALPEGRWLGRVYIAVGSRRW